MKHHAQISADGFTLDIVYPTHPLWSQVIEHVSQRYQEAFFAELKQFMPAYLTSLTAVKLFPYAAFASPKMNLCSLNSI